MIIERLLVSFAGVFLAGVGVFQLKLAWELWNFKP